MDCIAQSLGPEMIYGEQFYPPEGRQGKSNPLGYWESDKVVSGITGPHNPDQWMKVIFYGLQRCGVENLGKIIVAMRNPAEQSLSMQQPIENWLHRTKAAIEWLNENKLEYLVVDYGDMLRNPELQLERISAYTGLDIRKHRVRRDLYRNRAPLPDHPATELYLDILSSGGR